MNQPLSSAIQTNLKHVLIPCRWLFCSREPRLLGKLRRRPSCAADSVCSAIYFPAAWSIWWARILRIQQTFQGGLLGTAGGSSDRAGRAGQRRRCNRRGQPAIPDRIQTRPTLLRFGAGQSGTCLPPVAMTAVPDGTLHAPYFMQWSFALEHQWRRDSICAPSMSERARSTSPTYRGEWLSDRLRGLLCAVSLWSGRPIRDSGP